MARTPAPKKNPKPTPTTEPEAIVAGNDHLRDTPDRRVALETTNMKSSYCNVCNASTTRDEVVINFGLNQNWDRADEPYQIDIQHRVILSPLAAKRLRDVLNSLLEEYEARHGPLAE
ncbi:DUF3467 domain-containing protein [Aquicoccus sp. G2-2]|uniref:DUF3467 domain-containing protein n=1 Tax=Aquicoccus sp. G2-2 TaxID=3092120 RepID=UPI002ADFE5FC|nr:DUF3467 domain-containing protein [Aquicoccus sp. G2-2]MEA1112962.1 DUF3467 domain-containing protein [Aquicoccus sp. G2-2]